MSGQSRLWQSMTSGEAEGFVERDPVVVLPLAAIEQHGPHLPLSTDLDIGLGLVDRACELLEAERAVAVLPPVAVGTSSEHGRFAGTLSLSPDRMVAILLDIGSSLATAGVRRLVLANSHGGNRFAMDAAGLALRSAHDLLVVKASYFRFDRPADTGLPEEEWRHGLHGGAVETAMMLHLRPDLLRSDGIAKFSSLGEELDGTMRVVGPEGAASFSWLADDLNPEGVVGDATLATADLGARLVDHYAGVLADVVRDAGDFPLDGLARR